MNLTSLGMDMGMGAKLLRRRLLPKRPSGLALGPLYGGSHCRSGCSRCDRSERRRKRRRCCRRHRWRQRHCQLLHDGWCWQCRQIRMMVHGMVTRLAVGVIGWWIGRYSSGGGSGGSSIGRRRGVPPEQRIAQLRLLDGGCRSSCLVRSSDTRSTRDDRRWIRCLSYHGHCRHLGDIFVRLHLTIGSRRYRVPVALGSIY